MVWTLDSFILKIVLFLSVELVLSDLFQFLLFGMNKLVLIVTTFIFFFKMQAVLAHWPTSPVPGWARESVAWWEFGLARFCSLAYQVAHFDNSNHTNEKLCYRRKVISWSNIGQKVFIPRLSLTPSNNKIPSNSNMLGYIFHNFFLQYLSQWPSTRVSDSHVCNIRFWD